MFGAKTEELGVISQEHDHFFSVDARSFLVGELFQTTLGGAGIQTTNKTVLIPNYRFEADGKLVGWRICSESSGYVSLQVIVYSY